MKIAELFEARRALSKMIDPSTEEGKALVAKLAKRYPRGVLYDRAEKAMKAQQQNFKEMRAYLKSALPDKPLKYKPSQMDDGAYVFGKYEDDFFIYLTAPVKDDALEWVTDHLEHFEKSPLTGYIKIGKTIEHFKNVEELKAAIKKLDL